MNKTFLILLTGIAIGMLLAPAKGSETWKKIVDGVKDYKDKLSEEEDDLINEGEEALQKTRKDDLH